VQNLPTSYAQLEQRLINDEDLKQWSELQDLWPTLPLPVRQQVRRRTANRLYWDQHTALATWFPTPTIRRAYPKQIRHFAAGSKYDERALFGGNRTGKTHCGTFEDTLHLIGLYPDWWEGKRYDHPINMWVATDTAKNTRDILQEKFCGEPGVPHLFGTGMIPVDFFLSEPTTKHGLANAFESMYTYHFTNGIHDGVSRCMFKSYDQGRQSFQGTHEDLIHLDEEPKIEIHTECTLRLMSTGPGDPNGQLVLTETPLLGISELMIAHMPELSPTPDASPVQEWDHEELEIRE
jgi:phage terminase large subunit-like protein